MPKRRGSIPFYSRSKLHLWPTCTLPATCTPPELTRQRQPEQLQLTSGPKVSGAPQYFFSKSPWENSEKWRPDGFDRDKNTEIEGRKALKRAEEGWRIPGGASVTCLVLTLMWQICRSLCSKSDQTLSSLRGGPWLSQEKAYVSIWNCLLCKQKNPKLPEKWPSCSFFISIKLHSQSFLQ